MATINSSMNTLEWMMLIVLSILWGGSFFFIGIAVVELPPLTIVALRVGMASIALWGIALLMGFRPPKSLKVWLAFLIMGLLNNVFPFVLIVWGQTKIASGLASILNAATPIFTVIVAGILLTDERITSNKLVGVALGLIGVIVMIGLPEIDGESNILAQLAIIAATLSYAFAGVFGRRFKTMAISPIVTAAGSITTSALVMIPIALVFDGPLNLISISIETWAAVIGLVVLSTVVAYIIYFKILESAGVTNLMLVTLMIPISAIFLGSLFLNEQLETVHYVGMALITLGLSAIDGRLFKRT